MEITITIKRNHAGRLVLAERVPLVKGVRDATACDLMEAKNAADAIQVTLEEQLNRVAPDPVRLARQMSDKLVTFASNGGMASDLVRMSIFLDKALENAEPQT